MKLASWNVNGLRACYKKGCWQWVEEYDPDILCLQETKATAEQLDPAIRNPKGYFSYFDHSKNKKGYSGVAIFSKVEPTRAEYGLRIDRFDNEGRCLALYFRDFVLVNVYFPNGGGGSVRLKFKLDYYNAFLRHIKSMRDSGLSVIFCGDVNTAHKAIDLARPKENEKNTGFLPIERTWIDKVINLGFTDAYRYFHPNKSGVYTYWDMKTFARDRNVGWRLDYFFVSDDLRPRLARARVFEEVMGSDHCPISLETL